jgi:hypothetical protein
MANRRVPAQATKRDGRWIYTRPLVGGRPSSACCGFTTQLAATVTCQFARGVNLPDLELPTRARCSPAHLLVTRLASPLSTHRGLWRPCT